MTANQAVRWVFKPAVFLAGLGPAAWLVWAALDGGLSANPLSDITNETGVWTLRLLCVTLVLTPLRRLTGWNAVIRFRRMVGLFAFFYGTLHFLIYLGLDRLASIGFGVGLAAVAFARAFGGLIAEDLSKRPFITMGFIAFMGMLPLAITSTAGWIRRLGGKRWNLLHRLIYVSATAGVIHYWWGVKSDIRRPLAYAVVVAALLGFRLYWSLRGKPRVAAAPATTSGSVRL